MKKGEAFDLLTNVGFQEGDPASVVNLARIGKNERLTVIRGKRAGNIKAKKHCAAIEITRYWRGYQCRNHLIDLFLANDSTIVRKERFSEQPSDVPLPHEIPVLTAPPESPKALPEATVILTTGNNIKEGSQETTKGTEISHVQQKPITPEETQNLKISDVQQNGILSEEKSEADLKILKKVENPTSKKHRKKRPSTRVQAATAIQKAWRRHVDTQVFRYYKDLINFRRQGNPSLMLRCINPAEAKLLDAATGTHIKFRLAGEKYPPNIYYKIFTHRPIVDMCANSPKAYTKAEAKQAASKQVHTKNVPAPYAPDKDGWYVRTENNGWRLVSDRLIHAAMDSTTWETSKKTMEFHHDKLIRKADLDKRRRQKKITWMQKMYKQGMLQVKAADSETTKLVKKAADGLINTVDSHGPDGVMDWEVDELLQWTTALNFDDYLEGWKETATSNLSEYDVEEMLAEKSSKPEAAYAIRYKSFTEHTAPYNSLQIPPILKNQ